MQSTRLNVIKGNQTQPSPQRTVELAGGRGRRLAAQANFDRQWLLYPDKMNPLRSCRERERVDRTVNLIQRHIDIKKKKIVDLGCGSGVIARRLRNEGSLVDAVDISRNALKLLNDHDVEDITQIQDYVPITKLEDDRYDLVVCLDVIADLPRVEHRLLFTELVRVGKLDGMIIASTALDIHSEDALRKFTDLVAADIQVKEWVFSYHRLHIQLMAFFKSPARFIQASKDREYRRLQQAGRSLCAQWWLRINSTAAAALLWAPVAWLCSPVVYLLKENRKVLLGLEAICRFIWNEEGISHAMFIGQRRPLTSPLSEL